MKRFKIVSVIAIMLLLASSVNLLAQKQFGDLAEGPYDKLVIRNAMVIPGHGGPPVGPYDIVIEGNMITEMIPFDPVTAERRGNSNRPTGDRVIEADGKYVMPGMIDLHMHLRQDPMEIEYVYYTKLAHGVTTMVPAPDRGLENAMDEAEKSSENEILAPKMFPIWGWGTNTGFDREFIEDPENASRVAEEMFRKGAHVVSVGSLGWNQDLLGAATKAVTDAGGITTYHIPPNTTSVTQAVDAARLGVTMIEHHYAYAESSLDRSVQDYPRDYNYNDENARFRHAGKVWTEANRERLLGEVADSLFAYGDELAVAIFGIINRIMMFANFPVLGITQGFLPIAGYNFGAQQWQRVKETIRISILSGTAIAVVILTCILFFAEPIVSLFTNDPDLLGPTPRALKLAFLAVPLITAQLIGSAYFQAVGKALPALFLTMTKQGFFLIPLVLILPLRFGLDGIWYAFPLSDILAAFVTMGYLLREVRRKLNPAIEHELAPEVIQK